MRPSKKWLYWTIGILLFFVLVNFTVNFLIRSSLPKIIEEKNDTPYHFRYGEIGFSLLNSSIKVKDVDIRPKKDSSNLSFDFTAKVDEIGVVGVNFIKLLTQKDLSAYSIKIKNPDVVFYQSQSKDTIPSKLGSSIHVSNFKISGGRFKMIASDRKTLLSKINYVDIELDGVNLSQQTIEKNIPFTYSNFDLFSSEIFFEVNPSQILYAKSLKINDNLFILNNFKLGPAENPRKTGRQNTNYRLLPEIQAPSVTFTQMDWGFDKKNDFYFQAGILKFDSVDINIKNVSETGQRERDSLGNLVPFKLKIDKIMVGRSRLRIKDALDAKNINILIENIENKVGERFSVENILLKHPNITTYTRSKKAEKAAGEVSEFINHIVVKNFRLENALYQINRLANNENLLKIKGINFTASDIEMTPQTFYERIPVKYADIKFTAASFDYNPNHIYSLKTKNIQFDNGDFRLNNFEMKPKISRAQFVRQLKQEKDLYTITTKTVDMRKINFGFHGNDMYFKVPEIQIQAADVNIYRSKIPPDDPKKKLMYSEMLRELPFILEVKQLALKDSKVEYEEETETSEGTGKLTFSDFNADIKNIYSGRQKSKVPDVVANIRTRFMNDSKLNAVWTFNPMNRTEKFNIKGNISSFNATKMTPFIKPYSHFTAEGNIQKVQFNFTGNDVSAAGTFGIKYKGLKVTVYNPKNEKERKLITAAGNLLVKTNTGNELKKVNIETVERNQQRSFYNFFWHCVQQGLKQTLLII